MSNEKKLFSLMDRFSEDEYPGIYYAWQAVKLQPDVHHYREHLLGLLAHENFDEEYETVLREGIKACPLWYNGHKLIAIYLKDNEQYREALYNARIARNYMPDDDEIRKLLIEILIKTKKHGEAARIAISHLIMPFKIVVQSRLRNGWRSLTV